MTAPQTYQTEIDKLSATIEQPAVQSQLEIQEAIYQRAQDILVNLRQTAALFPFTRSGISTISAKPPFTEFIFGTHEKYLIVNVSADSITYNDNLTHDNRAIPLALKDASAKEVAQYLFEDLTHA